jgi:hypothetical protein
MLISLPQTLRILRLLPYVHLDFAFPVTNKPSADNGSSRIVQEKAVTDIDYDYSEKMGLIKRICISFFKTVPTCLELMKSL